MCQLTPSTPARISSNSVSSAHSAVENELATPPGREQLTELISETRSWSPCEWANAMSLSRLRARPVE